MSQARQKCLKGLWKGAPYALCSLQPLCSSHAFPGRSDPGESRDKGRRSLITIIYYFLCNSVMKYETCTRQYWEYRKEVPNGKSLSCVGEQVGPEATRPVWGVGFRQAVCLAEEESGQYDCNSSFWGALGWKGAGLGILATLYQA